MKRVIVFFVLVVFLAGCSSEGSTQDKLLQLRQELSGKKCQFISYIHADFGENSYDFSLLCQFDINGDMAFSVQAPETIAGITGRVSASGGLLTFDSKSVAFSLLADGELTPVSAPWLMMKGLRSGYLSSWGNEGKHLRLRVDDSYENSPMQYMFILNEQLAPVSAEIVWEGRCILSVRVEDFRYL